MLYIFVLHASWEPHHKRGSRLNGPLKVHLMFVHWDFVHTFTHLENDTLKHWIRRHFKHASTRIFTAIIGSYVYRVTWIPMPQFWSQLARTLYSGSCITEWRAFPGWWPYTTYACMIWHVHVNLFYLIAIYFLIYNGHPYIDAYTVLWSAACISLKNVQAKAIYLFIFFIIIF